MCNTCGCNITSSNEHLIQGDGRHAHTADGKSAVAVLQGLLSENDHQAAHNREHLDHHGVLAVNLMSSPGAGKTSLLEATIEALGQELRVAVIEGDLATENDAARIRAKGVLAIQITTGSACHLDAHMIHEALHRLDLDGIDLLFIENVGNLVCPASFDLGQHLNVILLSVPEGDDKPAKYPVMFRAADLVLCSKSDLLPLMPEFDPKRAEHHLRALASTAPFACVSVRSRAHLEPWLHWLRDEWRAQGARLETQGAIRPGRRHEGEHRSDPTGTSVPRYQDHHHHEPSPTHG